MIERLRVDCQQVLSEQQVACAHRYFCFPLHRKALAVFRTTELLQEPLLLSGHHGEVRAVAFGRGDSPVLLCSASDDYIIVWDVELCRKRTQEGQVATGLVIWTSLRGVVHLSFCFSDQRVAVCSGETTYILSSKGPAVISTLISHQSSLTAAEFCPWNPNLLVTTSEDRTFTVWDLHSKAVFYQSFVLSASPLLTAFFWEEKKRLITGSYDGQVWCFSFTDDHKCHLVAKMDLHQMEKRQKVSQKAVGHAQAGAAQRSVEISKPVLRIASCSAFRETDGEQPEADPCVCIGSYDGLYVVDLASWELRAVLRLKDHPDLSFHMASSWSVSSGSDGNALFAVSSLFSPCVALLELRLPQPLSSSSTITQDFSVFPSSPPLLRSPLNAEFRMKEPQQKGRLTDKPVVLQSRVKSSGYTSAPRSTMFTPKTNVPKAAASKQASRNPGLLFPKYPMDGAAPTAPFIERNVADKRVSCLQFSGDGKQVLCGLGDSSVFLYKSHLAGSPAVFIGHEKAASCVSWSRGSRRWLSASDDPSLRVWTPRSAQALLTMGKDQFSKPIRGAQFYYLDKFLLVASGPALHMYLHRVDSTRGDTNRYDRRGVVKLASRLTTTSATDITAMSSINDFCSYIVLVGGSNKSIQAFDVNRGGVAWEVPDAHSRAVHCIAQNKAYVYDVRSGSVLQKLQRLSDTVLSVTFNPATPELLAGTLDGRLKVFRCSSSSSSAS